MSNTIDFIKEHAPLLGAYLESCVDTQFSTEHDYNKSNYLADAFCWDDHPLGYDILASLSISTGDQLKALEGIYTNGHTYPTRLRYKTGEIMTVYGYVPQFKDYVTIGNHVVGHKDKNEIILRDASSFRELLPTIEEISEKTGITKEQLIKIVKNENI